ncbi:hypothetical protein Pst134EB_021971 [Puccinia striiformis f. sp. tritici]|nr:hypothetical protein Pst134EB_021971 [Puccinia striiformis f. sp. tritici]
MYQRKQGFELGNGKVYSLENLADMLTEKIPPTGELRTRKEYRSYLRHLCSLTQVKDAINFAEQPLAHLEWNNEIDTHVPDELKARSTLTELLEELDQPKLEKFQGEYEAALLSLQPPHTGLQGPITEAALDKYFPSLLENGAIDTWKLARARAIQLTAKSGPDDLTEPVFSTAEEVIHTLPTDLDLTSEVYRYWLIKGFEEYVLQEVRPRVKTLLADEAGRQVANFYKNPSGEMLYLQDYISKLGEADFERWFGEHPSTVYHASSQNPSDRKKIVFALKNRMKSLSTQDFEALEKATSNRREFKKKLALLKQRISSSKDQNKAQYLETLGQLENEAVNNIRNNYPYVEEMFKRKMIDESTRAKLNPPNGMIRSEFLATLGTQDNFTQDLLSQFRKNLLKHTLNSAHLLKAEKKGGCVCPR